MKKTEIALTVGGTLASLALTYLLWRIQQKDAAEQARASAQAASTAQANAAASDAQFAQSVASLPSVGVGNLTSATVPSTATVTNLDATPTDAGTSTGGLLAQILNTFAASGAQTTLPVSQEIPALTSTGTGTISALGLDLSSLTRVTGLGTSSSANDLSNALATLQGFASINRGASPSYAPVSYTAQQFTAPDLTTISSGPVSSSVSTGSGLKNILRGGPILRTGTTT